MPAYVAPAGNKFAILGAGGYIAPRHMEAIYASGNSLAIACDTHDSVGVLDAWSHDIEFAHNAELMFRSIRQRGDIRWCSICTPTNDHNDHIRMALASGCHVIVEKPAVVRAGEIAPIVAIEELTGLNVWVVQQLRHHPKVIALREMCATGQHDVVVHYQTPRGPWYGCSWKSRPELSGGIILNIGVHIMDVLLWCFGPPEGWTVDATVPRHVTGTLDLARAHVRWSLSTEPGPVLRSIRVDGYDYTLDGFGGLHRDVYLAALNGTGVRLSDTEPAIRLCNEMAEMR